MLSSSFCSELCGTAVSLLLPILPSLLSCLVAMTKDTRSPDVLLLVVIDTLQLVSKARACVCACFTLCVPVCMYMYIGGRESDC